MHLAAAAGVPVTAVFGPTDERATRPLGDGHAVVSPTRCGAVRACCASARSIIAACAASASTACRRAAARRDAVERDAPAVFLDRDGTLIEEVGYLDALERVDAVSLERRRDPRVESRRLSPS